MDHHTPFALAPLEFFISAPRDLPAYAKDDHNLKVQYMVYKVQYDA
jgi:hypothetical protein